MEKFMNGFLKFANKLGDLFFLNIVYLLCCLPIVTIGSATTSLYHCCYQFADNKDGYLTKTFFSVFKTKFRTSTIAWILLVAVDFFLYLDFSFSAYLPGTLFSISHILIAAIMLFLLLVEQFVFPVFASRSEDCTIKEVLVASFRLCVFHPFTSLLMLLMNTIIFVLPLFQLKLFFILLPFILFIGFSGIGCLNARLVKNIWKSENDDEDEAEN